MIIEKNGLVAQKIVTILFSHLPTDYSEIYNYICNRIFFFLSKQNHGLGLGMGMNSDHKINQYTNYNTNQNLNPLHSTQTIQTGSKRYLSKFQSQRPSLEKFAFPEQTNRAEILKDRAP